MNNYQRLAAPTFLALAMLSVNPPAHAVTTPTPAEFTVTSGPGAGADANGPTWEQTTFRLSDDVISWQTTRSGFTAGDQAYFGKETISLAPDGIGYSTTTSHS